MNIRRLLVANRGEIAIRIFRAASELGIQTIAVFAEEDKLSLHRSKADEAYQVGAASKGRAKLGPLASYLSIDDIIEVAVRVRADAIHPGYGFLSESPEFADACEAHNIQFIGPRPATLRILGNKVTARNLAERVGVPVVPATPPLPDNGNSVEILAEKLGYPVMLKASWGGGGRGMRPIESPNGLIDTVRAAKREALSAFGKDEVYLEKLIRRARHIEVQILGDLHGNLLHLFERDCSIQRRNQKVIERAPAPSISENTRNMLCDAALKLCKAANYVGAGTVEFLLDDDTNKFYFIEVNPRIQVEHTVTEQVTGLDIVKAQIKISQGGRLGVPEETGIPPQAEIRLNGHALQCRITTEDAENNFIPDYGRITAYRGAFGFGIRVDGGTAYSGAIVTRHYDALLEKVTAWAPTAPEAISRMDRALREYRIRGVITNLPFLEAILNHPHFRNGSYTTKFIDETPELITSSRKDRATKLLTYIADVTVNGHPDIGSRGGSRENLPMPEAPSFAPRQIDGTAAIFRRLGPDNFSKWILGQQRTLITDTTMRDSHQSLLATRLRTFDITKIASSYASGLPELFSLEYWGGATFDVALRFLNEDPWERLALVREQTPAILSQMLLRGANGVGYANYPDNVVQFFVKQSAEAGIDVFRIFDCFNWIENMRIAIDAVRESGKLAEGAICYTGDILDPARSKFSLDHYVDLAKQLENAGCNILCIKDMAGLLKPTAARVLVKALKEAIGLPIHLHTHDTSGAAAATVLAAVESGVDIVDAAIDSMSGGTAQPCLGALVEELRHGPRDTGLKPQNIRDISFYWENVRGQYRAFESEVRGGSSEVYLHEMPGGQFTNLKEQARSLGLEERWQEIAQAYRGVNDLFGDIVKVTPSSKVVGDLALMLVTQRLTPEDVVDPAKEIVFPESVVEMMRGDLGQPVGGWPKDVQRIILKEEKPINVRPGSLLKPADLDAMRCEAERAIGRPVNDIDLASYLMYPKQFADFVNISRSYGPVAVLPTPVFYYGMDISEERSIDIESGKSLIVTLIAIGEADQEGQVRVFFELNGQPRVVKIADRSIAVKRPAQRKAEDGNNSHIVAPMPGAVAVVFVTRGQTVKAGEALITIEAMKMETVLHSPRDASIVEVLTAPGQTVDSKDLLVVLGPL